MILDAVVKWPGSVNDLRMFHGSGIRQKYETGKKVQVLLNRIYMIHYIVGLQLYQETKSYEILYKQVRIKNVSGKHGMLLGDSAYQLSHFMMVPFGTPENEAQEAFNAAHRTMRSRVEQTFGILKSR